MDRRHQHLSFVDDDKTPEPDSAELTDTPETQQVRIPRADDREFTSLGGFRYRRCGGGRQVIRRAKGGG